MEWACKFLTTSEPIKGFPIKEIYEVSLFSYQHSTQLHRVNVTPTLIKALYIHQYEEKDWFDFINIYFIKVPTQVFSRPTGALIIKVIKQHAKKLSLL